MRTKNLRPSIDDAATLEPADDEPPDLHSLLPEVNRKAHRARGDEDLGMRRLLEPPERLSRALWRRALSDYPMIRKSIVSRAR